MLDTDLFAQGYALLLEYGLNLLQAIAVLVGGLWGTSLINRFLKRIFAVSYTHLRAHET